MVKGWFQDTLPKYKDKIGAIAVLRVDADWYESTKCCLENLYDNVVTGGYIFVDDYGFVTGCKKATDNFLTNKKLNAQLVTVSSERQRVATDNERLYKIIEDMTSEQKELMTRIETFERVRGESLRNHHVIVAKDMRKTEEMEKRLQDLDK